MAVFVFGAGATRGASFVNSSKNPCLPPLDGDFFTQLQRIQNSKHNATVQSVVEDTTDLFGVNFRTTMETLFTTLEHTARMVETTGESRDFKKGDLEAKKERLKQAIAATLEESLCAGGRHGVECKHHAALVRDMKASDELISFNYDCLLDETLKNHGKSKWDARYGYGFLLKGRGALTGDQHWQPSTPAGSKEASCHLYKLHGSLHFQVKGRQGDLSFHDVKLKDRPYTKQNSKLHFTIIPPESNKSYDRGVFKRLWKLAGQSLHRAKTLVIIGYSFPPTDSHANALFRISVKKAGLDNLVIVNPDREARRRTRDVLSRGLGGSTRVHVFDYLSEFAATPRTLWDR
jgi:hypothetical protein